MRIAFFPPLACLLAFGAPETSVAASVTDALAPCRVDGIAQEVRCGTVEVPEDPRATGGRRIGIQFAVIPALAKNKAPDPLFVLAGGPGQAATQVASVVVPMLAKVNTRRDIVFVDQRGTGKSNPLLCNPDEKRPRLADTFDVAGQIARVGACLRTLDADPRQYATWIAVRDLDAVRMRLHAAQINLWGASYGTRVGLEYLRQFPDRVRTAVLDGVAPPDMRLPASFAVDGEAALDRMIAACARDAACAARYPDFATQTDALFRRFDTRPVSLPLTDPVTGRVEQLPFTRESMLAALRTPLYAPQLAVMLPYAVDHAFRNDFSPLAAMLTALGSNDSMQLAWGMHFAVICAEDMPRIDASDRAAAAATRFGTGFIDLYERACKEVPHQAAPAEFYDLPTAAVPVLLLSGGADPATPPRHAATVAKALPNSRHLIAPNLGHGISAQGCAPELIARFVRQASFDGIDGACLERLPAPPFFRPPTGDSE
ncbi:MAG TPA: alpha/beta fold hydrolase [Burkholderiaceae bacterium]|nr:alpha/beta fold hydrolase [Burkholderiaceae bacterium]